MRLATWNVNSVRARIDRLESWLLRNDIDVLALQESKAKDAQFPYERLTAHGYEVAHHGINQWNGVAVISRVGLDEVTIGFPGDPGWGDPPRPEARAISALAGGIRVVSLYVPNGRALDDPHMDYKIAWLEALRTHATAWLSDTVPTVLCGDWNIAPRDEDVWSMEYYADKSHVSPRERAAFQAFLDAGWSDVVRPHAPGPRVYTYWDYTQLRFPKKQGMRIDFLLGSPALDRLVTGAAIDREERKGKGASDHAPVVVELAEGP